MTIEEKRYKDLQDYFSDKDCAKAILENDDEFKKWLERLKWHVKKCDELAMELKAHREAWELLKEDVMSKYYTCKINMDGHSMEMMEEILGLIYAHRPKEGDGNANSD